MKAVFASFGLCALVASSSAQSIYMTVSNCSPSDGETVTLDVVLDATSYAGDFFAWHEFSFNIGYSMRGPNADAFADAVTASDEPGKSAPSDTTGDGNANFGPFGGAWETGRRPGAFPGAGALAGGVQSGPSDVVITDTQITTTSGSISGRQASPGAEGNVNIHQGRVFEVFRFSLVYSFSDFSFIDFYLEDLVVSAYTTPGSDVSEIVTPIDVGRVSVPCIPAPATAPVLLGFAFGLARRRRA